MLLTLFLASACSRQIDVPNDDAGTQTDPAPFRAVASNPLESTSAAPEDQTSRENILPFHESQNVPAGTLLTIRLNAPIGAGKSESFEGSLTEPLILHGKMIFARGTLVSGRVESAGSTSIKPDRAYVRLALTSLRIAGADVPVRTASLFARTHTPEGFSAPQVRLEKGRRLTFRLTEPVDAASQSPQVTSK